MYYTFENLGQFNFKVTCSRPLCAIVTSGSSLTPTLVGDNQLIKGNTVRSQDIFSSRDKFGRWYSLTGQDPNN